MRHKLCDRVLLVFPCKDHIDLLLALFFLDPLFFFLGGNLGLDHVRYVRLLLDLLDLCILWRFEGAHLLVIHLNLNLN